MRRETKDSIDSVFFALADSTRRSIIARLTAGPASIKEIGAEFPISKQAISRHIKVLEDAGLVTREVKGRTHRCQLVTIPFTQVELWIQEQRNGWNLSLDRLGQHLQSMLSASESSSVEEDD